MAITIHQIANWNGQEKNALLSKADEIRIESAQPSDVRLRVSWTEHRTYQSILTTASRNCCASQTLLLWTHNPRRRLRAGEVCDLGTSEREAKTWNTKTSYSSSIARWVSNNVEQITRDSWDRAGWKKIVCDVQHGRLTITPDGTAKEEEAIVDLLDTLQRYSLGA